MPICRDSFCSDSVESRLLADSVVPGESAKLLSRNALHPHHNSVRTTLALFFKWNVLRVKSGDTSKSQTRISWGWPSTRREFPSPGTAPSTPFSGEQVKKRGSRRHLSSFRAVKPNIYKHEIFCIFTTVWTCGNIRASSMPRRRFKFGIRSVPA